MYYIHISGILMLTFISAVVTDQHAIAADDGHHRQHDAHVHGKGQVNLAVEGNQIFIELDSPAANIVGFEHVPTSQADNATLDKALLLLKQGEQMFHINPEAGCKLTEAEVDTSLEGHTDDHHDAHDDKHEDEHDKSAAHKDSRGHDGKHEEEAAHSDIEAGYVFKCDHPDRLQTLRVDLFDAFPATEMLNVQAILETGQTAKRLTPAKRMVDLRQ
jgi:hypothetical protein